MTAGIQQKCRAIKLLVSDVDGVLTNGGIIYNDSGIETKQFNVKDGFICKHLLAAGIKTGIITGRSSKVALLRAQELKFTHILQGVEDKLGALKKILEQEGLLPDEVAYIGDDLNDLEILRYVGLSAAPGDAFDYITAEVDYICQRKGGEGAFREFADLILKYRNHEQDPGYREENI